MSTHIRLSSRIPLLEREELHHGWGRGTPAGQQAQEKRFRPENLLPVALTPHIEGVRPQLMPWHTQTWHVGMLASWVQIDVSRFAVYT